MIHEIDTEHLQ